jgi:hypothetical protein
MGIRMLRRAAGRLILVGGAFLSLPAQSDLYATPSLAVAEIYDDNLFFSSSAPQEDRILRLSPAIDAGYRSAPMTVHGRYTFDAERYARHPELDDNQVREHTALDFRYEATRLLTLSADASYLKTQTPGELTPETGLEFGRARAERFFFSPSLVYQFDRLTAGTTTYRFTRDKLAGGIGSDTHIAMFDLDRRITSRDTASFGYRFEQFRFDAGDTVTAHVLLVGGTREFTPRTAATVLAGPRFSDGSTDPEVSASLFHKLDQGVLGLAYTRSETTVIGRTGTATTETLGATLGYSLGSSIEIRAAPSFLSSTLGGLQADVFIMNLEVGYRIARYLTLIGSYEFSTQHGSLTAPGGGEITRNVVLLGLVIAAPRRTDPDPESRPRVLTPSTLSGEPPPTRTRLKLEEER